MLLYSCACLVLIVVVLGWLDGCCVDLPSTLILSKPWFREQGKRELCTDLFPKTLLFFSPKILNFFLYWWCWFICFGSVAGLVRLWFVPCDLLSSLYTCSQPFSVSTHSVVARRELTTMEILPLRIKWYVHTHLLLLGLIFNITSPHDKNG